jgi:hypothetical protein
VDWLLAVLTCLAVYRVTRLLVEDKLLEWPRLRVYAWLCTRDTPRSEFAETANPTQSYLEWRVARMSNIASGATREPLMAYMLTCPWCVSMWLGGLVVLLEVLFGVHVPYPLLLWPATSAVTGLLASRES